MFLGIDIGLQGGLALLQDNGTIAEFWVIPTLQIENKGHKKNIYAISILASLFEDLKKFNPQAGLEIVHAFPGQGVNSMFSLGVGAGIFETLLVTNKIPYTRILPQVWKKAMMFGMGKEKHASVYRATQIYPHLKLDRIDHGIADAILIARYLFEKGTKVPS